MKRKPLTNTFKLPFLALVLTNILACTPMTHPAGPVISSGQLVENFFITRDGTQLPLKTWHTPSLELQSVIIAIHGFNDYSNFFQLAGSYFSQHQTISYAYDQRGFGGSPSRGLWAGIDTYIEDLNCFIQLIKHKHPDLPIYLLGESMGAAIIISAITRSNNSDVNGIILVAPAIWARQIMPWYQNALLWTLSHTVPQMTFTGQELDIMPSDNIEILIAFARDPLVIKATRVESIYGLVNLMDDAFNNASLIPTNTLLLYGQKDEVIPKEPTYQFVKNLTDTNPNFTMIALYKNGYHMLLRDLQAPIVWNDIDAWINSFSSTLPSGADKRAQQFILETTFPNTQKLKQPLPGKS